MRMMKMSVLAAAVCAAVAGVGNRVYAITLTASTLQGGGGSNGSLTYVNTTSPFPTSNLYNSGIGSIDSLFYLPDGRIVYDLENQKQVHIFDPNSPADGNPSSDVKLELSTNTGITPHTPTYSGFSSALLDMALEPGQTTFLISDNQTDGGVPGGVYRMTVPAVGSNITTIASVVSGGGFEGIAINPAIPTVFYVANDGKEPVHNAAGNRYVDEYSSSGAFITQDILPGGTGVNGQVDGLTWDPFSGELWGAVNSVGIEEFFVDASGHLTGQTKIYGQGNFGEVDGITTDSVGHLYFVVRDTTTDQTLQKNTVGILDLTQSTPVFSEGSAANDSSLSGLDDLAPGSGLGALIPNNPVPLPASVWTGLSLLGGMGLVALVRRRRQLATVRAR